MTNEDNRTLLKWGGISTYLLVLAFIALIVGSKVFGMVTWKLWLPLFSIVICLWVMVLLAGHEYLKRIDNTLAKIGAAFGALLIVVLFAEVAAWGAYKMTLEAASGVDGGEPTVLLALFNSTHSLAIWFHGLWLAFWGAAFIRLDRQEKVIGALFLFFTGSYAVYYLLLRLGLPELGELAHSVGHVALILSHWMLAGVFLSASKKD